MSHKTTYAIDFGTSNSLLAAVKDGKVTEPIGLDPENSDPSILRSLMYFSKDANVYFGHNAIKFYTEESGEGRFIRSVKKYLPSEIFTGTKILNKTYKLEELIGRFLKEMKSRADLHFKEDVRRVVLGRPAKFSADEKEDALAQHRLKVAAEIAGFTSVEFFPEPLAAAYNYRSEIKEEKLVLVVDLGGGTSDFTVIKIRSGGVHKSEDVLALGGVSVAGDALDGCIMTSKIATHFGSEVKYQFPMSSNVLQMPAGLRMRLSSPPDITLMSRSDIMGFLAEVRKCTFKEEDNVRLDQLFCLIRDNLGFPIFESIELCKRMLCTDGEADFAFHESEVSIDEHLSYQEFIEFSESKVAAIFNSLDEVISQAQISHSQIDSICCTGGTSKVPVVAEGLAKRFGREKIKSFKNFHSVIQGLAERANEL